MSLKELGLAEPLLNAIAETGYETLTPIQQQAIPAVLKGGDLLAGAQTGTGKTAGFVLPILHRLAQGKYTGEAIINDHIRPAGYAIAVQTELSCPWFRCYTHTDVVGAEVGGALKNVIAIAVGMCDGLGRGLNARAGLVTRGLREITRLGVELGANPLTFQGLSGMGDLILTCTGELSRNRQVGLELGRGRELGHIVKGMQQVAEGIRTTFAACALAERLGVEMPIAQAVRAVLQGDVGPEEAGARLMTRQLRSETAHLLEE